MTRDTTSAASTAEACIADDTQDIAMQATPLASASTEHPAAKARKVSRRSTTAPHTDSAAAPQQVGPTGRPGTSKADLVLKKLRLARGVTVAQIMEATGWQAHSVRGFLSAVVRKKLGLDLVSEIGKDGQRRYRIVTSERDGTAEAG